LQIKEHTPHMYWTVTDRFDNYWRSHTGAAFRVGQTVMVVEGGAIANDFAEHRIGNDVIDSKCQRER
jgi:hypothetical protein